MENNGVLLLDKGFGLTSFEAVSQVRSILKTKKAGHTGTLDPQATGLLIIMLNKATKLSGLFTEQDKTYHAKIKLGESRASYDRFSRVTGRKQVRVDNKDVQQALNHLEGEIQQIIPLYSAVHFEGKRMYQYAREGREVPVRYGKVNIYSIELLACELPLIEFNVTCSSGTYIRSLAHQLGEDLGCGAHLYSLRRTKVGDFELENALTIGQVKSLKQISKIQENILPLNQVLNIPSLIINNTSAESVRNGREITLNDIADLKKDFTSGELISIQDGYGDLLAFGTACVSSQDIRNRLDNSSKVFDYKRVI